MYPPAKQEQEQTNNIKHSVVAYNISSEQMTPNTPDTDH